MKSLAVYLLGPLLVVGYIQLSMSDSSSLSSMALIPRLLMRTTEEYDLVRVENRELRQKDWELNMKLFTARVDKLDLVHKLKNTSEGIPEVRRAKKQPGVQEDVFISEGVHRKVVKDVEKSCREFVKLQAAKAKYKEE